MGDWFQTVVDVQATSEEADRLVAEALGWLVSEQIVAAERTDCVLGSVLGYPPGVRADEWVDSSPSDSWRDLWTNGLDITTGRTVADPGQGDPTAVRCPHCVTEFRFVDENFEFMDEAWKPFNDVVPGWIEGRDTTISCPACRQPVEPASWQWVDYDFVFGYLGFTFWNWPPLRPEFTAGLSRRLGGHRVVLMDGKL